MSADSGEPQGMAKVAIVGGRDGPCPRTRAFLMAHASTLTINIYRTRQEGALYLLVN